MAGDSHDNAALIARTSHPDSNEQTSKTLLAAVHDIHVKSLKRNDADNVDSVRLGIDSDKKGIALADQTIHQAEALQNYLQTNGDFSTAAGKKMGEQFIAQLRKESDEQRQDRSGAQEFVGKEMPEAARQQALKESNAITDAAKKMADPTTSEHDRAEALAQILKSADAIGKGLHDSTGKAGKDQRYAVAESGVIAADVKALQGATLTPEQKAQLTKDIASKAGLIRNELNDAPNERNEIQHDTNAMASGAKLEAMLRYAMSNPGHAKKALEQVKAGLNGLNSEEGIGTIAAVKIDRQQDMVMEPIYMAANSADNAQNNSNIIEFTNPYVTTPAKRSRN